LLKFIWITVVILELIHANTQCVVFIREIPTGEILWRNHNNLADFFGSEAFKFLPYQLSMVVYWTTMAMTGDGELGFDSGEGA
jgi:hypothetical protein